MLQLIDSLAKLDSLNLSRTFVDVKVHETSNVFGQCLFQPDTLVALLALLVSVVAIVYNRKTYKLTKENNVLSAKPLLEVDYSTNSNSGEISVQLINNGLGPAQIKNISFNSNGKYESQDIPDLMDSLNKNNEISFSYNEFQGKNTRQKDHWIAEKSKMYLYSTTISNEKKDTVEKLIQTIGNFTINVHYSDIYGNEQIPINDKLYFDLYN